ncbi:MAG: NAD-dependent epimerase/dehydratase family protein, partial [Bacillota bacterium]|nr:NAD-dependent epimerase/dehydratase family protein [Bacillota bacterium]
NRSRGFIVNTSSIRSSSWREINFEIYDCVIYMAGAKPEHEDGDSEVLNYHLNSDMPFEIASAAKAAGVTRFLFPSTMDVYGKYSRPGTDTVIEKNTAESPEGVYASSKLAGENRLKSLEDDSFRVMILRLPLVYGPGCPGAYDRLKDIVLSRRKLPEVKNRLSVINVSTLCAFIQYIIENDYCGTFHPQNKSYLSTADLMDMISKDLLVPLNISKWLSFKYRLFKKSCPEDLAPFMGSLVYSREIDL